MFTSPLWLLVCLVTLSVCMSMSMSVVGVVCHVAYSNYCMSSAGSFFNSTPTDKGERACASSQWELCGKVSRNRCVRRPFTRAAVGFA